MTDKWQHQFHATRQPKGEHDVILSSLPAAERKKLWEAIKTRNPAKAALMQQLKADAKAAGFDGELTMTSTELEEFMKQ